jgi:hypothetical protein
MKGWVSWVLASLALTIIVAYVSGVDIQGGLENLKYRLSSVNNPTSDKTATPNVPDAAQTAEVKEVINERLKVPVHLFGEEIMPDVEYITNYGLSRIVTYPLDEPFIIEDYSVTETGYADCKLGEKIGENTNYIYCKTDDFSAAPDNYIFCYGKTEVSAEGVVLGEKSYCISEIVIDSRTMEVVSFEYLP